MKGSTRFSKRESRVFRTGSGLNTSNGSDSKKYKTYLLWPEFSDSDINSEKWENTSSSVKSKEHKSGKSPSTPSTQQLYEDFEGKIEMPSNMQVQSWTRLPQELSASKAFVVVENEEDFDLINYSKHLCHFPLMRMIMSQITLLWNLESSKKPKIIKDRSRSTPELTDDGRWRPWEHIYSMCKSGRGHMPLYNPTGKYVVRLYYMGCWRKIVIDDLMPYNSESHLMLPTSAHKNELWPMLLSKALIKVASVNYRQTCSGNDMRLSEFSVIHALTGWLPEITPLCPIGDTWDYLKKLLPEWKYPTEVKEEECIAEAEEAGATVNSTVSPPPKNEVKSQASSKKVHDKDKHSVDVHSSSTKHEKTKDIKKRGAESSRERQKSESDNNEFPYATPESVIFATFDQSCPTPAPLSVMKNMADGSEVLRNMGLSQMMFHPILIKKTRSVPLIPAEVKAPIPRWKLIRPRPNPSDTDEKKPEKPDMWLEVSSPFLSVPKKKHEQNSNKFTTSLAGLDEFSEHEGDTSEETEPYSTTEESHQEKSSSIKEPNPCDDIIKPSSGVDSRKDSKKVANLLLEKKGFNSTASVHSKRNSLVFNEDYSKQTDKTKESKISSEAMPTGNLNNEYSMSSDEDMMFIKSVWIDFDDFCKTFKNIIVFHKTNTFRYNNSSSEYKTNVCNSGAPHSTGPPPTQGTASGKKNSLAPSTSNIHGKHASPSSIFTTVETLLDKPIEESQVYTFLMVDSILPSEVIICLSSLVYWPGADLKQLSIRDSVAGDSTALLDIGALKGLNQNKNTFKGHVVVEPYSWVDSQIHQPVLDIKTNGVFATCLLLPPGRNVFRLNISWNYGYHIHVCSTTPFVYGDEDTVMAPLKGESERFRLVSREVAVKLDALIASMGSQKWKEDLIALKHAYNKLMHDKRSHKLHDNAFLKGLYIWMEALLTDVKPHELQDLLHALTLDFGFLECKEFSPSHTEKEAHSDSSETMLKQESGFDRDQWQAATTIQKYMRGYIVRKTMEAHRKTSVRDQGALPYLSKALKACPVVYGNFIMRQMLKKEPSLITNYDFCGDEPKKVCFTAYNGEYAEQPAHHWFVVFRGVFHADDTCRCVPKLYGISNKTLLHVVDNDTGEEIRRVFNRPVTHVYTKNQNGYTFAAELKTFENPLSTGKWKMKLMGSDPILLAPANNVVETNFAMKEIRGFYVPNSSNIIFRYVVQCKVSQLTSILFETSDKQVEFLMEIFNKGKVIASRQAKAHLFLPYCYFVGKTNPKVESEAPPPPPDKSTGKPGKGKGKQQAARAHSPKEDAQKKKERKSTIEDDEELENRLYYIQLTVLNHSWKLNEEQLAYVAKLKEIEREEMKLESSNHDGKDEQSSEKHERSQRSNASTKGKGSKSRKSGKESVTESIHYGSSLSSSYSEVNYDASKAYWSMKVVCDADRVDDIDIRRDRTRLKEIKAMKQAWEAMDEGRAARAKESRQKFLESLNPRSVQESFESDKSHFSHLEENEDNMIGEEKELQEIHDDDELQEFEVNEEEINKKVKAEDTEMPEQETVLGVMDPFSTSYSESAKRKGSVFYDVNELNNKELEMRMQLDEEEAKRQETCDNEIEENFRQRTLLKEQLMEECQKFQLQNDLYRTRLMKPRNEYRQALLADAQFEQEKRDAAMLLSHPPESSKAGKGSKKKKK